MALNRDLDSMQTGNVEHADPSFNEFSWAPVEKKRCLDVKNEGGHSPKRMIMELSNEEEQGPPIVIHINSGENLVLTDENESMSESSTALAYLENNGTTTSPVFEDNMIRKDEGSKDEPELICGFPVYKLKRNVPFLNETLELCMGVQLNKELVCHQVPPNVQVASTFVVDFQCVRHHEVVARDRGCFGRQSSPTRHVAVKIALDHTIEDIKTIKYMTEEMMPEPGYEFYKIRRHYTWHKFISGLSRVITRLEYKNELFRYGVVQFKVADEEKKFASNFKPSNQTQATPERLFVQQTTPRTSIESSPRVQPEATTPTSHKPSTKSALNSPPPTSHNTPPKPSNSQPAETSCKNEIFNILQNADKPRPKLSTVPDYSKLLSLLKCDEFLCDVSFCSIKTDDNERILNPRTFAMGELQRHWLESYCTANNPKSVVSISTVYKLGNLYLTTLTCPLPIFVLKDDPSEHPTVLLGLMTSLTNEKEDFEYLVSKLRQQGITSMVYGTDGASVFDDVLEKHFPTSGPERSVHLCCFDKAKETIMQKLDEFKVKTNEAKNVIIRQILGSGLYNPNDALVDQRSEGKFHDVLANIEPTWPMGFREWIRKPSCEGGQRSFYDVLRRSMLRTVRTAAGLGDPPKRYSNQDTNRCITDAISELEQEPKQSVDLTKVHETFKNRAVDAQITDFVKAMYNMGQLRLAKENQHLTVSLLNVDKD